MGKNLDAKNLAKRMTKLQETKILQNLKKIYNNQNGDNKH